MIATTRTPRLARLAATLSAVSLVGCASTPHVTPAAAAAAPPPPPAPAMVTMAPIANPEEPTPSRRDASRTRRSESSAPPAHHASAKAPPPPAGPPPSPPPAAQPHVDPARAAQLRARGLEQLNRGSAAQAVVLLSQASRLDPDNILIRRDLERAERINRAVGGAH